MAEGKMPQKKKKKTRITNRQSNARMPTGTVPEKKELREIYERKLMSKLAVL